MVHAMPLLSSETCRKNWLIFRCGACPSMCPQDTKEEMTETYQDDVRMGKGFESGSDNHVRESGHCRPSDMYSVLAKSKHCDG